jgi:hypothetical protein
MAIAVCFPSKLSFKDLDPWNPLPWTIGTFAELIGKKRDATPLFLKSSDPWVYPQPQIDTVLHVFARQVDHFEKEKIRGMRQIMLF